MQPGLAAAYTLECPQTWRPCPASEWPQVEWYRIGLRTKTAEQIPRAQWEQGQRETSHGIADLELLDGVRDGYAVTAAKHAQPRFQQVVLKGRGASGVSERSDEAGKPFF